MEILQVTFAALYLAGCVATAIAADQRTAGPIQGFIMAMLCTPLVAGVLILAYPSREEIAYYQWLKKKEAEEKAAQ